MSRREQRTVPLGELVEIEDSRRIPLSGVERVRRPGPYPYYGAAKIFDYIDDFIFEGDRILVGEDGSVVREDGRPFVQHAKGRFWVNNHAHVLRPVDGVDLYFLKGAIEVSDIRGFVTGAAQPKLTQANLKRIPIPDLPREDQVRIGLLLRSIEGLMEVQRQRIEVLEQVARLIYREWFVHFRFPGHEEVKLVDSDLGPIPRSWNVHPLSDLLELAYGKALKADDRRGGEIAVYGSGGVVGWHNSALVEGPGVVVGRKGNVGAVYWSDVDFYPIDTTYFVKTELPLLWVYHLLQTLEFIDSHAAVPGLSREQAYGLKVVLPERQLLATFNDVVTPMYGLRRNLLAQNDVLSRSRDLLLPRLISGELDVSDLDVDLEPVA